MLSGKRPRMPVVDTLNVGHTLKLLNAIPAVTGNHLEEL